MPKLTKFPHIPFFPATYTNYKKLIPCINQRRCFWGCLHFQCLPSMLYQTNLSNTEWRGIGRGSPHTPTPTGCWRGGRQGRMLVTISSSALHSKLRYIMSQNNQLYIYPTVINYLHAFFLLHYFIFENRAVCLQSRYFLFFLLYCTALSIMPFSYFLLFFIPVCLLIFVLIFLNYFNTCILIMIFIHCIINIAICVLFIYAASN